MRPEPTEHLTFREMADDDLDDMARLLGDPEVMQYYPRRKTREDAQRWIDWNQRNYAEHGYGLWVIQTRDDGSFVGDCGLTWQEVDGSPVLEIGYHIAPAHQGFGYATEAAKACLNLALGPLDAGHVTAIINPDNAPSRRVAEKMGMTLEFETTDGQARPIVVYGCMPRPT
ncbi:MAG: GNAT family N-acetyltransferase [Terracoccus sp.]